MASVLVVAVDPKVEFLLKRLVAGLGYRPFIDNTVGAAGESVRRLRPDVCLLDRKLPASVLDYCLEASDEVGAQPVFISGATDSADLVDKPPQRDGLQFSLAGGAELLGAVLERAIAAKRRTASLLAERTIERPPG